MTAAATSSRRGPRSGTAACRRLAIRWVLASTVVSAAGAGQAPPASAGGIRPRTVAVVACDDRAAVHVNGEAVGEIPQWDIALSIDVSRDAFPMLIAVEARNYDGHAALIGALRRTGTDGKTTEIPAQWRCSPALEPRWTLPEFDDEQWAPATEVAAYGAPPWGDAARLAPTSAIWAWLRPPGRPNETIYCRWRIAPVDGNER